MTTILDNRGNAIVKKEKPLFSRAQRRQMARDPDFHHKRMAGDERIHPYYRLLSYGQLLVSQMLGIQHRMNGVPYARSQHTWQSREQLSEELTNEWNDCVERLGAVQDEMKRMEIQRELELHPEKEAEIYGLC